MHTTEAAWGKNWVLLGKDIWNNRNKRPASADKGIALSPGSRRPLTIFYESEKQVPTPFWPRHISLVVCP